jgi:peptide/nickel transport system substrate-binding protein
MKRLALSLLGIAVLAGLIAGHGRAVAPEASTASAPAAPASSLSILPAARADDAKGGEGELGLAGEVKVDEFNSQVKDKKKGDGAPCRGGVIRVRIPADPKSLNALIDTDATTQMVFGYLYDSLAAKDGETFEWLPQMARFWKTRDLLFLTDGRKLEGRVVSEDDKGNLVFAEGASKWTLAKCELEPFADGDAKVTWKKGCGEGSIEGALSTWPGGRYTVFVEEKPTKTISVKAEDIKPVEEESDGKKTSVPGILREAVYEFTLRKGIKWTDGEPFKVDDILFTYRTFMNEEVLAAPTRADYSENMNADIAKAVVKVSDDVVRFELRKQYFRALTITGSVTILPAHRYSEEKFKGDPKGFANNFNNHADNSAPVGNGRYRFSSWDHGKALEVVRNDDWWGSRANVPWINPLQPYLDRVQWIIINNKNAALRALENGEIDADFDIEQLQWVDPETNKDDFTGKFVRAKYNEPIYTYIGWNEKRTDVDEKHRFFTDARVRMAMTMLIDRKKILQEIHYGLGEMVTGPFFQNGPFYDHALKPIEYNPEKAKALLDEAGWVDHTGSGVRDKDGVPFEFTYNVHNAREYHLKIAEIVKQDLEKAGIKVNIKSTDFNSFMEIVNGRKFDAVRFAFGDPDCVDSDPYGIWHSSQWAGNGQNAVGYANPEVDEICVKARRELNFKKRQRMFKRLHKILHEEQPFTFLFNLYGLYFYSNKYRNVKLYILGTTPYSLDEWYIPKELQKDFK